MLIRCAITIASLQRFNIPAPEAGAAAVELAIGAQVRGSARAVGAKRPGL